MDDRDAIQALEAELAYIRGQVRGAQEVAQSLVSVGRRKSDLAREIDSLDAEIQAAKDQQRAVQGTLLAYRSTSTGKSVAADLAMKRVEFQRLRKARLEMELQLAEAEAVQHTINQRTSISERRPPLHQSSRRAETPALSSARSNAAAASPRSVSTSGDGQWRFDQDDTPPSASQLMQMELSGQSDARFHERYAAVQRSADLALAEAMSSFRKQNEELRHSLRVPPVLLDDDVDCSPADGPTTARSDYTADPGPTDSPRRPSASAQQMVAVLLAEDEAGEQLVLGSVSPLASQIESASPIRQSADSSHVAERAASPVRQSADSPHVAEGATSPVHQSTDSSHVAEGAASPVRQSTDSSHVAEGAASPARQSTDSSAAPGRTPRVDGQPNPTLLPDGPVSLPTHGDPGPPLQHAGTRNIVRAIATLARPRRLHMAHSCTTLQFLSAVGLSPNRTTLQALLDQWSPPQPENQVSGASGDGPNNSRSAGPQRDPVAGFSVAAMSVLATRATPQLGNESGFQVTARSGRTDADGAERSRRRSAEKQYWRKLTFASGGIRLDASSVSSGYGTCAGALMEIRRLKGSPCGRFIAAGCHDGTVVVWGVAHMQRWLAKHATAGKFVGLKDDAFGMPEAHIVAVMRCPDAVASGREGVVALSWGLDSSTLAVGYIADIVAITCLTRAQASIERTARGQLRMVQPLELYGPTLPGLPAAQSERVWAIYERRWFDLVSPAPTGVARRAALKPARLTAVAVDSTRTLAGMCDAVWLSDSAGRTVRALLPVGKSLSIGPPRVQSIGSLRQQAVQAAGTHSLELRARLAWLPVVAADRLRRANEQVQFSPLMRKAIACRSCFDAISSRQAWLPCLADLPTSYFIGHKESIEQQRTIIKRIAYPGQDVEQLVDIEGGAEAAPPTSPSSEPESLSGILPNTARRRRASSVRAAELPEMWKVDGVLRKVHAKGILYIGQATGLAHVAGGAIGLSDAANASLATSGLVTVGMDATVATWSPVVDGAEWETAQLHAPRPPHIIVSGGVFRLLHRSYIDARVACMHVERFDRTVTADELDDGAEASETAVDPVGIQVLFPVGDAARYPTGSAEFVEASRAVDKAGTGKTFQSARGLNGQKLVYQAACPMETLERDVLHRELAHVPGCFVAPAEQQAVDDSQDAEQRLRAWSRENGMCFVRHHQALHTAAPHAASDSVTPTGADEDGWCEVFVKVYAANRLLLRKETRRARMTAVQASLLQVLSTTSEQELLLVFGVPAVHPAPPSIRLVLFDLRHAICRDPVIEIQTGTAPDPELIVAQTQAALAKAAARRRANSDGPTVVPPPQISITPVLDGPGSDYVVVVSGTNIRCFSIEEGQLVSPAIDPPTLAVLQALGVPRAEKPSLSAMGSIDVVGPSATIAAVGPGHPAVWLFTPMDHNTDQRRRELCAAQERRLLTARTAATPVRWRVSARGMWLTRGGPAAEEAIVWVRDVVWAVVESLMAVTQADESEAAPDS